LTRLGWDEGWEAAFAEHAAAGLVRARVAIQHRGAYDLATDDGEVRAPAHPRLARAHELPAVGDWVALDPTAAVIEAVLPRRTVIARKEAWTAVREQVLAANVEIAFLAQGLPLDFSPRRLERYLAMTWESGAQPVVLLTKADLVEEIEPFVAQAVAATRGACPVHAVSVRTGAGLDEVRAHFAGNRTAVVLGSSGVGKSTLVNALAGDEHLATREVRASDQKGRHTTVRRELVLLAAGGVILDTPGMRELQLWDADLEQTFGDVEEIASRCRFADCAHDQEPGCAVQAALADGTLDRARWESYLELHGEIDALEARRVKKVRQQADGRRPRES
jgi:ribosome biogenesis GTPase / thiamine phosphate phosphatase